MVQSTVFYCAREYRGNSIDRIERLLRLYAQNGKSREKHIEKQQEIVATYCYCSPNEKEIVKLYENNKIYHLEEC